MLTFGYKTKLSSLSRALAAIGVGLVMALGSNATEMVVKLIACFVIAAGIVSLIAGLTKSNHGAPALLIANAVLDCAIGALLFFNPTWIASFIVGIIGFALIAFGALQLIVLSTALSLFGGGFTSLILSVLAILGGVFLVFNPFSMKLMSVIAGVLLVMYGVSEIMSTFKIEKAKKEYEVRYASNITSTKPASGTGDAEVADAKEVEFTKVDD